jgi:hypothetical protein
LEFDILSLVESAHSPVNPYLFRFHLASINKFFHYE